MLAIGFFLVLGVAVINADVGSCPTPKVQANFDLQKFAGTWYEIEASPSINKVSKKCSTWLVEHRDKGKAGLLQKYIFAFTNKVKSDYADITTPKSSEPAKLLVAPQKGTILGKKYNFWVLETDYSTYAVGFSCKKLLFTNHQEVFILSRTKKIDDKKKMEIYNMLSSRSINQKNLIEIDHKDEDCSKVNE